MSDEEYVDGYVCGSGFDDAEHASFTDVFETREEAIKAGMDDCGWIEGKMFQTARIVYGIEGMPNQLDAEGACDRAENSEWGEALVEEWTDKAFAEGVIDSLQTKLDEVWKEWTEQHKLQVRAYRFEEIEHHEFKEDDQCFVT